METEIPIFIQTQFTASQEFQGFKDKDKWEMYQKLIERMAAFTYLAPVLPALDTMKKITGESKEVLGGYADRDFLPDLLNCPVSHLVKWKASTGSGSTPCIMFLNRQQLSLWSEKRLIFLEDYSVGKTTMLKFFLGTVNDWGQPAPIEAVMDIQNRQHLSGMRSTRQLRNAKKYLKTVTAHELQTFYYENAWNGTFWKPHMMKIMEFYLKNHPSANSEHIFIDEAPILQNHLLLSLHMLSSFPFKAKHMWKTFAFGLIYFLIWMLTDIHWAFLLPPALLLAVILCVFIGFFPPSFSPSGTAKHLNAYSDLVHESSTLWIAMHTRFFKDRTVGVSNIVKKSDVEKFKAGLGFTLPKLSHNMRNSAAIRDKCSSLNVNNYGNSSSHVNDAIETAVSPPSTKTLTSNPTCKLELASYNKQLEEAVKYAYRNLLKVKHGQEEKCVVILMEDGNDTAKVKTGLIMAGVNPEHLTVYLREKDVAKLKIFLKKPKGVLLTTDVAFSGMEASSVLYLSKTGLSNNHRGTIMRAVSEMVQISGACCDGGYTLLDMTFMRCSNKKWPAEYHICTHCNLIICLDCEQTCHGHGEKQNRGIDKNVIIPYISYVSKNPKSHQCLFSLKGTIKGIFMAGFRCCECNIDGECLLKNQA